MSFHRFFFVSWNPNLALEYQSDVTEGYNCQNWRSSGGQIFKSTKLDLLVSFHRFFFVSGNPNLALWYCSDVTGSHNCHLEVIIRGQLEVNHLNLLYWTFGCLFIGFFVSGNPNLALKYCSDVTGGHKCQFKGQNWDNWRLIIKIYCLRLMGVFSYFFCIWESKLGTIILLRCHRRS